MVVGSNRQCPRALLSGAHCWQGPFVERAWYVEASCSAIEWPCIHGYSCTETGWLHLMVEQCLRPSMPLQPLLLAIVRGSDSLSTNELCIRDPGRIRCSTTPFLCLRYDQPLPFRCAVECCGGGLRTSRVRVVLKLRLSYLVCRTIVCTV